MTEIRKYDRVLFGILDWGMGHITRSIPIIRQLLDNDVEVFPAASGMGIQVLKTHFPNLEILSLPPYSVNYSKNPLWLGLVQQLPKINTVIREEYKLTSKWRQLYDFTAIISDNRMGVYSSEVPSYYITHQLTLKQGIFSSMASRSHKFFYSRFNEVWVPDAEGSPLGGDLSNSPLRHKNKIRFIGHPSRFTLAKSQHHSSGTIVFLLSGPEPLRTLWEQELILQACRLTGYSFHLIRGSEVRLNVNSPENMRVDNWLSGPELEVALRTASLIIARSGYSTLLDLSYIQKPLVAFPTPGQGEQTYLANYLEEKGCLIQANSHDFNLESLIEDGVVFEGRLPMPTSLDIPIN